LGNMNKIPERVSPDSQETMAAVARPEAGQSDARICALHKQLADLAEVRWKESIKEVVGLPLAKTAGLDL